MASNKQPIVKSPLSLNEILTKSITVGPTISKKLGDWIDESKSIKILVAGKAGTGKSTLINGIVGKQVTKEGRRLTPETSEVQHHILQVDEVTVQIFDSPGLQDKTKNEEKYIAEIRDKCSNVDLFLYCIKMSEVRFFTGCDDAVAMKRLFKALGTRLWANGIIVLTFANDLIGIAREQEIDVAPYFQDRFKKITRKIRDFLRDEVKIQSEIANNVTIVCAGHIRKPLLPSISDEDLASSTARDIHWLSYIWLRALHRTKLTAQPAMIKLNLHRILRNVSEYSPDEMADTVSEIIEMQPIMLGQQGAEIGKEFGEAGEDIGLAIGETAGRHAAVSLGIRLVILLIFDLAIKHGIVVRIENRD